MKNMKRTQTINRRKAIRPISASIAYIELTKNQFCLIDVEDADELEKKSWHSSWDRKCKQFRAKGTNVYMHRLLIGNSECRFVDHRNRNTLDNRKSNLRLATNSENCANVGIRRNSSTGYRGVTFISTRNAYKATFFRGKQYFLGYFPTAQMASITIENKLKEIDGEFYRNW